MHTAITTLLFLFISFSTLYLNYKYRKIKDNKGNYKSV